MRISTQLPAYFASLLLMMNAASAAAADGTLRLKNSAIHFTSDLEAALLTAKTDDRPVYLAFGAAWCPVCREMQSKTLLEPPVQALAEAFIWVAIDIDRNVTLANEWGVEATPTIFLLEPSGNPRLRIVGGTGADDLASMLEEFLDDLETGAATGEPVPAQAFEHTALISKPGGFRGKSICFSNVGYGPLSLRSQSPFQSLRLGILPRTPSTLARGEHQMRIAATWANVWANEDRQFDPENGVLGPFLLDYESLDANISYAYGLSDTFQIELEYEQRWRFGGVMDGFIEGFHDLFASPRESWRRSSTT
jgi:thiol-disulfide isomerase/thioredoxin